MLSPLANHVALSQCGEDGVRKEAMVYSNTCLVVRGEKKKNYKEGKEFCANKGMVILRNETQADFESYEFIK